LLHDFFDAIRAALWQYKDKKNLVGTGAQRESLALESFGKSQELFCRNTKITKCKKVVHFFRNSANSWLMQGILCRRFVQFARMHPKSACAGYRCSVINKFINTCC
jgi:hypothetical protein